MLRTLSLCWQTAGVRRSDAGAWLDPLDMTENRGVAPEARRMTMRQIAEVAGVSIPTISKVLNGRGDVSAATRQRVTEALAELDYLPRGATSLPMARRHVELTFDALINPNNLEIMRGVVDAAQKAGGHVAVSTAPGEPAGRQWVNELVRTGRDGLILVTSELSVEQQQRLSQAKLPVVLIDPVNIPEASLPSVGATNFAGGMAATELLLQLGHRRIMMLRGRTSVCETARFGGFTTALAGAGLAVDASRLPRGDFRYQASVEAAHVLLAVDEPPTAIFAANDFGALAVIDVARQLGLRVPEDLSVVGFDDMMQATTTSPSLTTVKQPLYDMGAVAYEMLTDLIEDRTPASHRLELATTLIVRESTAPPRTHTAVPPHPA
jgi:LacI family transcriptional regulator